MPIQQKQLGQLRPGDTNAASLYSPPVRTTTVIDTILISNTTANTPSYRIFVDNDGSTYDQTTAIAYDVAMSGNEAVQLINLNINLNNSNGNLAVRTSAANEITFTAFGTEITS